MQDAAGRVVGVRLRFPNGRKLAVRGGHEGLFIPCDLPTTMTDDTLLVCEGPSDTATALDLGHLSVGRPSCTGGVRHVVELVQRHHVEKVVVLSDTDAPGRRGSASLAAVLSVYVRELRIVYPPSRFKDLRAWRRSGATRQDLDNLILSTRTIKAHIRRTAS